MDVIDIAVPLVGDVIWIRLLRYRYGLCISNIGSAMLMTS